MTERWCEILGLGLLVWLVPFVLDLALLPLQLFNHLGERLAYTALLALSAGICGWVFLEQSPKHPRAEALCLGGIWLLMALLLDIPARWLTAVPRPDMLRYGIEFALPLLAIPLAALCCGIILQDRQLHAKVHHIAPIPRYMRKP